MKHNPLVFIILLLLTGCSLNSISNEQNGNYSIQKEETIQTYLNENHSKLDINGDWNIEGWELLEEDMLKHDVFFLGENHGVSLNFPITYSLLGLEPIIKRV